MPWFAIRSVYLFATKTEGINVFEERVVCFEAETSEIAHVRAEAEAEEYARENGFELYPEQSGYQQDGRPMIDNYEVWSELFEARQSLQEFYACRYTKYLYDPV
jgi:hypothetical protein